MCDMIGVGRRVREVLGILGETGVTVLREARRRFVLSFEIKRLLLLLRPIPELPYVWQHRFQNLVTKDVT